MLQGNNLNYSAVFLGLNITHIVYMSRIFMWVRRQLSFFKMYIFNKKFFIICDYIFYWHIFIKIIQNMLMVIKTMQHKPPIWMTIIEIYPTFYLNKKTDGDWKSNSLNLRLVSCNRYLLSLYVDTNIKWNWTTVSKFKN